MLARVKEYRAANRDRINAQHRKTYHERAMDPTYREKIRAKQRAAFHRCKLDPAWRAKHNERQRLDSLRRYAKNREQILARAKARYAILMQDPVRHAAYLAKRRAQKAARKDGVDNAV